MRKVSTKPLEGMRWNEREQIYMETDDAFRERIQRASSSEAERRLVKPSVEGSTPSSPAEQRTEDLLAVGMRTLREEWTATNPDYAVSIVGGYRSVLRAAARMIVEATEHVATSIDDDDPSVFSAVCRIGEHTACSGTMFTRQKCECLCHVEDPEAPKPGKPS